MMKDPKTTLGKIVRSFKAQSSRLIHAQGFHDFGWQRSYYDHVIRSEESLNRIREYITANPMLWIFDKENHHRRREDDFDDWIEAEGRKPLPIGSRRFN
jgi:Transposase IS200 like